ncbi:endoplasmic reticulum protein SC65 [Sardina pilchardus]|uniref:endoplasmic reticulum protein SC65 n=1 Tax=Sardina pilchardus TaxID=27697 RepID=UPI002E0FD3D1
MILPVTDSMASLTHSIREISLYVCLWTVLFASMPAQAQYEKYSFKSFSQTELMPLESAYGYALEQYGVQNWKESIKYLEISLRLHRLLKDSEAYCSQNCSHVSRDHDELFQDTSLRIMGHVLRRASCLKNCKKNFPVFSVAYPKTATLEAFERRDPYRYMQYAFYQLNYLERAVSAAHTFLQRNPGEPLLTKNMNYYKSLFDVDEYLIDHEEKLYEGAFLKAVKLFNAGDFSNSAFNMEQAATEYLKVYDLCLAACEGSYEVTEFKDFYPTLADLYVDMLQCKVKCEANLTPNEAVRYFNQTTKQKEMLEFAQNYLQTDDEDVVSPEEQVTGQASPPDQEFEGLGDYEESFLAEWWQEPQTKGDNGETEDRAAV